MWLYKFNLQEVYYVVEEIVFDPQQQKMTIRVRAY
jgi:hypothetical protein